MLAMFIETETTPYPARLKFLPACPVMEKGTADFTDANDARRSPLATALFGVEGITRVFLGSDFITVTKSDDREWDSMKTRILGHHHEALPIGTTRDRGIRRGDGPRGIGW